MPISKKWTLVGKFLVKTKNGMGGLWEESLHKKTPLLLGDMSVPQVEIVQDVISA